MYMVTGRPFSGRMLEKLKAFLAGCSLDYDSGISFSATLVEDGEIIATGSLDGSTIKCVAVSPERRGEDLCAPILTALRGEAFERGRAHLMLYTKPANETLFTSFGFYPLVRTGDCLLMENSRDALARYLASVATPQSGSVGCVVANCNPFTLGHRYLIESAAKCCDRLHVFILSEDRGILPPETRLEIASEACRDIPNADFYPTDMYMVSAATFPDYFIRDKSRRDEIYCGLDLKLFATRIAPALRLTKRFVGTEPYSETTRHYNEAMKRLLPPCGIEVSEIARLEADGQAVSASRVRALIAESRLRDVRPLVPENCFEALYKKFGGAHS